MMGAFQIFAVLTFPVGGATDRKSVLQVGVSPACEVLNFSHRR